MADTNFQNGTVVVPAWLNDANTATYDRLTNVAGTNTITATGPLSMSAYAAGQNFRFVPAVTNTGPVTININGLGALAVTKSGATALVAGDLVAGTVYEMSHDGVRFQVTNPTTISTAVTIPFSQVTGTVPIAQGGTGQTTTPAGLIALGGKVAGNYAGYQTITGTITLTVADIGKTFAASVTNPVVNLPVGSTLAVGDAFHFSNSVTLTRASTDQIINYSGSLSNTLVTGNFPITLVWRGSGVWAISAGASSLNLSASTGYVRLPGGILYQFGTTVTTTDVGGNVSVSWPTAFTGVPVMTMATNGDNTTGSYIVAPYTIGFPTSTTGAFTFRLSTTGAAVASSAVRFNWIAIGAG